MSALRKRLAEALAAGRATAPQNPQALATQPTPPPLNVRRVMLALVQGQALAGVQASLLTLKKIASEKGIGLVLVTDQTDVALFQLADCITEYLPAPAMIPGLLPSQDPQSYVARRLGILMRKWEPVQVLPFGTAAQALFEHWQSANPRLENAQCSK